MRYVGNSVRVYFSRVKKKKMQRKTREKERERERETRLTQTNVCVSVYIVELHLLKRNFVNWLFGPSCTMKLVLLVTFY